MPLKELRREGLLLPEEHWGRRPKATFRARASVVVTFLIGLVSAWMIWEGDGGWVTFLGTGIFLLDLVLILLTTFMVVDTQVDDLESMDLDQVVVGMEHLVEE